MEPNFETRTRAVVLALALVLLCAAPADADLAAGSGEAAPPKVDLNLADVQALVSLPGVGEAMAQRILDWRAEHGRFERVEDLIKVKGIGEKSFEKLRPFVTVEAKP